MKHTFKSDRAVVDAATPGPWTAKKPGSTSDGWPDGVIIAAVARGQGVYAKPPGGSFPEADRLFIVQARTRWPAALDEVERLRAGLRDFLEVDCVGGYANIKERRLRKLLGESE